MYIITIPQTTHYSFGVLFGLHNSVLTWKCSPELKDNKHTNYLCNHYGFTISNVVITLKQLLTCKWL